RLHRFLLAGEQHVAELVALAVSYQAPRRVGRDEDLERRDLTASDPREELLVDDAREGVRQLHPDLRLTGGREDIDESVDRLARVVRVQRSEHEVTGLC